MGNIKQVKKSIRPLVQNHASRWSKRPIAHSDLKVIEMAIKQHNLVCNISNDPEGTAKNREEGSSYTLLLLRGFEVGK